MVLKTATLLAQIYGHKLDDPLTYPTGVAFSGRLRLARSPATLKRLHTPSTSSQKAFVRILLPSPMPPLALPSDASRTSSTQLADKKNTVNC